MLETNYVDEAEEVMKNLTQINLTTSQLRKFLTSVNIINNKISIYKAQNPGKEELSAELMGEIQYMRVKLVYQGREGNVKTFIEKSKLVNKIKQINSSIKKFEEFSRYVEALVAYHKFYGGKDK